MFRAHNPNFAMIRFALMWNQSPDHIIWCVYDRNLFSTENDYKSRLSYSRVDMKMFCNNHFPINCLNSLTHSGLVTPFGDRDLDQHWLRRHQATTWSNVDWSSEKSGDIHIREFLQEIPQFVAGESHWVSIFHMPNGVGNLLAFRNCDCARIELLS